MSGKSEVDAEVKALQTILKALAPLDADTRRRVLAYVRQRFAIPGGEVERGFEQASLSPLQELPVHKPKDGALDQVTDIRTLKEQKQPKSAVEMSTLVAFYLSELASGTEKKASITTADLTKYFKQAQYRLPPRPRLILHQAKNAGYLDSGARGEYSLNPVGYNLVTHGLPRTGQGDGSNSVRRPKKVATKPGSNKKSAKKRKSATPRGK